MDGFPARITCLIINKQKTLLLYLASVTRAAHVLNVVLLHTEFDLFLISLNLGKEPTKQVFSILIFSACLCRIHIFLKYFTDSF